MFFKAVQQSRDKCCEHAVENEEDRTKDDDGVLTEDMVAVGAVQGDVDGGDVVVGVRHSMTSILHSPG